MIFVLALLAYAYRRIRDESLCRTIAVRKYYAIRRVVANTLLRTSRRHIIFKYQYVRNTYGFEMRKNEAHTKHGTARPHGIRFVIYWSVSLMQAAHDVERFWTANDEYYENNNVKRNYH